MCRSRKPVPVAGEDYDGLDPGRERDDRLRAGIGLLAGERVRHFPVDDVVVELADGAVVQLAVGQADVGRAAVAFAPLAEHHGVGARAGCRGVAGRRTGGFTA